MSEESKEKMKGKRRIHVYYKGSTQKKTLETRDDNFQSELDSLLKLGWDYDIDEETKAYLKEQGDIRRSVATSLANTGTTAMYYPDGTYYGRIPKDSAVVAELGLIHIRSEKQKEQAKEAVLAATAAKLGTNNYNNGLVEIKSREHPGEGWVLGRLPRSEEHHKNQKAAASAAIKGSTTWNDGNRNYRLRPGQSPESHWVKGMAPRK